ncbi:MBL fold metallo-hydrolase [Paenibacillus methanolicus]|uniref:L-ascorbate metabolism protein UlaG (Beta-lactamase superfamily) n=1 Tax=Paenibacillus methanolicus TaxID=582686 RepID=A0A5S5C7W7_9BACL|nr:MBL fold metallo-hydrolase [Paenibacillus methanolicus]TYP74486.1 L-ascorbate metabolism protein UlaG (beta-lactamase superfamily) [Paenibacillus methanolicus]
MKVTKLPWAGIKVEMDETHLVIDPLYHFPSKFGQSHEPLFPLSDFGGVEAVLITHHHPDHFDPEAIARFYGEDIPVYLPSESLRHIHPSSLKQLHGVELGQSLKLGSVEIIAAFSMDGFGDPQVSWIVRGNGQQLIHCGDTLWHGHWWNIKNAYGPFDVACLPVNAAIVEFRGDPPSGQPISLSPEQAVSAAKVLGAKMVIPIHYKAIDYPPIYRQTPDLLERLQASARQHGVGLIVLDSKESIVL